MDIGNSSQELNSWDDDAISSSPDTRSTRFGSDEGSELDLEREFERRLASLIENAITSRSMGKQYMTVARRFLAAARTARRAAKATEYGRYLAEAKQAHHSARRCFGFARLCERRADWLAEISGYRGRPGF